MFDSPRLTKVQLTKTEQLQQTMFQNRQRVFRDKGVSETDLRQKVFLKPWVSATEMLELGFLDGLDGYHDILRHNADGIEAVDIDIPFRLKQGSGSRHRFSSTFTAFIQNRFTA